MTTAKGNRTFQPGDGKSWLGLLLAMIGIMLIVAAGFYDVTVDTFEVPIESQQVASDFEGLAEYPTPTQDQPQAERIVNLNRLQNRLLLAIGGMAGIMAGCILFVGGAIQRQVFRGG